MRPSLLNVRSRLKPLVWLLLAAMFPAFSPHLAQGVVLCIGDGHVAIESSQAAHHDSRAAQSDVQTEQSFLPGRSVVAIHDARRYETDDAPCVDVPLHTVRGIDRCHQAVASERTGRDLLPDTQRALATSIQRDEAQLEPFPTPVPHHQPFSSSSPPSLRSTVVLLI